MECIHIDIFFQQSTFGWGGHQNVWQTTRRLTGLCLIPRQRISATQLVTDRELPETAGHCIGPSITEITGDSIIVTYPTHIVYTGSYPNTSIAHNVPGTVGMYLPCRYSLLVEDTILIDSSSDSKISLDSTVHHTVPVS